MKELGPIEIVYDVIKVSTSSIEYLITFINIANRFYFVF